MSDSGAENAEKAEEQELPEEVDTAKLLETAAAIQEDEDLANIVTAEEYLMCKDVVLLEYEKQMFLDQVQADGLLVCAKGLSYERVLINILKAYSDSGNLVLVINSSDWEEQYYKSKMEPKFVHEVANTATERERVYLEGGLQFISTRILVVDLLKQRIPIELISGIIVLRAHTIIESCQEAFALRLYRQKNKTGFIKAFSSSPEAFTIGYSHVERTMRNLFVKHLYIWPRFHATVRGALQPWQTQTIELHVPLSQSMTSIQTHILDIMNFLVREIKRINRTVDMEAVTVENCVTKKFHKILQAQLDCIWHQLNSQTKLIVADLKILRSLMISTMYHDSVSAYALMKRYRSTEYALSNSGWTLLDAAEQIFKLSRQRVFNGQQEFEPEPCPKWQALTDLLTQDIPGDMRRCRRSEQPKVLILCQDARTCHQLKQYLTQGGPRFLLQQALHHEVPVGKLSDKYAKESQAKGAPTKGEATSKMEPLKEELSSSQPPPAGMDELAQLLSESETEGQHFEESYMLTMTQPVEQELLMDIKPDPDVSIFETIPELEQFDVTAALAAVPHQPYICLQTFKTEREGSMALESMLEQLQPHYVVMYNTNVTAIRQLEVFEARRRLPPADRIRVYFLIHARTVEEQAYLTSLRREKAAFELIIDTKSKMVIPEYQDGKTDEAFLLFKSYDDELTGENAKSRQAGGQVPQASKETPKVIVDMREFRSDLPCLIHKRGLEVLPLTITIGDYILTPDICVERKSISDLIGSLNSGRLYNQCVQMQRHYAKPILLIEFDQNKPFHLQGKFMLSQQTSMANADIVQKLQLLTLHFPKLRLIWSPSPYATAQLFEELKLGKPEPDPQKAVALGSDEPTAGEQLHFNSSIYDFLLRLPGVHTRNIHGLLRKGGSLRQLLLRSQKELEELVQSQESARLLYDILHVAHLPEKDEVAGSTALLAAGKQFGAGSHNRFRKAAAESRRGRR
ncbi:DNA repair endonuclease XPF [Drosophila subpulchrella]|uniref:DNA repair endonuclease XPF n=1 Tax=Drosophila subpulchrella TaxID=1486046 RepID=UPI0018A12DB4|nr:DNA repair endonuclease XPF [Drosophila subpulchrella]XP_037726266.1 DNA repair endonuclease XPF [Drosophila subpulchrella]XP_037726267.1 DNA repair endonuclease XPF [Drosophila subpulchrella]